MDSSEEPSELNKFTLTKMCKNGAQLRMQGDGFVLVVSEYNHGYSAVLKTPWTGFIANLKKTLGLVGVSSGKFGGLRAMEQIRPIVEYFGSLPSA